MPFFDTRNSHPPFKAILMKTILAIESSRVGKLMGLVPAIIVSLCAFVAAQPPTIRVGEVVPRDVREIYDRGLQYLASSQSETGEWSSGQQGPGVNGMALMVLLASGEDPNFGLYSNHIRRALRKIISDQNATTGFFGNSMYHHGFAMLALSEAYGAVDDRNLWTGAEPNRRSIGQALELAVRAAITSQKRNQFGGWRYSPESTDADTSVSGAVLVVWPRRTMTRTPASARTSCAGGSDAAVGTAREPTEPAASARGRSRAARRGRPSRGACRRRPCPSRARSRPSPDRS